MREDQNIAQYPPQHLAPVGTKDVALKTTYNSHP